MITSVSNQQIKNIIKLQKSSKVRREQQVFLVEGIRMFREIPEHLLVKAYVTQEWVAQLPEHWEEGVTYEVVSNGVFREMSDTQTPQGILAIVRQLNYQREDLLIDRWKRLSEQLPESECNSRIEQLYAPEAACEQENLRKAGIINGETQRMQRIRMNKPCILILENLQDPGNLGTIFRTAEGAGITGIMMSKDTVDIYNSKVVRSTMGAIFRMPFCYEADIRQGVAWLKEQGICCYGAHLKGKIFYDYDYCQPSCFLIGNEGNGLTPELAAMADERILIPMAGQVESLNAATAATVLMYEAMRQRFTV